MHTLQSIYSCTHSNTCPTLRGAGLLTGSGPPCCEFWPSRLELEEDESIPPPYTYVRTRACTHCTIENSSHDIIKVKSATFKPQGVAEYYVVSIFCLLQLVYVYCRRQEASIAMGQSKYVCARVIYSIM